MRIAHLVTWCTLVSVLPSQGGIPLFGAKYLGGEFEEDAAAHPVSRAWPSSLPRAGAFRQVVAARWTAQVRPDAIALTGDELVIFAAPGIHSHIGTVPGTDGLSVLDVATVRGRGTPDDSNPAHDALALACASGLSILRFDPLTEAASVETVSSSTWSGATRIAVHPTDPTAIFGISADNELLVALDNGSGYADASLITPLSQNVFAIECCDWEGDGQSEVAVLTDQGLTVYDRLGGIRAAFAEDTGAGALALLSGPTAEDQLAWLRSVDNSPEVAVVGQIVAAPMVTPLAQDYVAITAADWTQSGTPDLMLSTADNRAATLLFNSGSEVPQYQHAPGTAVDVATSVTATRIANTCAPVADDFDGDSDIDVFMPVEGSTAQSIDCSYTWIQSKVIHGQPSYVTGLLASTPSVTLTLNHVPGATHMQVVYWAVDVTGQLSPKPTQSALVAPEFTEWTTVVSQGHLDAGGTYVIMVRPVLASKGIVTDANPAELIEIQTDYTPPPTPAGGVKFFVGGTRITGGTVTPEVPPGPPPGNPPTVD